MIGIRGCVVPNVTHYDWTKATSATGDPRLTGKPFTISTAFQRIAAPCTCRRYWPAQARRVINV